MAAAMARCVAPAAERRMMSARRTTPAGRDGERVIRSSFGALEVRQHQHPLRHATARHGRLPGERPANMSQILMGHNTRDGEPDA